MHNLLHAFLFWVSIYLNLLLGQQLSEKKHFDIFFQDGGQINNLTPYVNVHYSSSHAMNYTDFLLKKSILTRGKLYFIAFNMDLTIWRGFAFASC